MWIILSSIIIIPFISSSSAATTVVVVLRSCSRFCVHFVHTKWNARSYLAYIICAESASEHSRARSRWLKTIHVNRVIHFPYRLWHPIHTDTLAKLKFILFRIHTQTNEHSCRDTNSYDKRRICSVQTCMSQRTHAHQSHSHGSYPPGLQCKYVKSVALTYCRELPLLLAASTVNAKLCSEKLNEISPRTEEKNKRKIRKICFCRDYSDGLK